MKRLFGLETEYGITIDGVDKMDVVEESLQLTEQAASLARDLISEVPMPAKAGADAIHIAVAVTNGMNYLLTWNCTHLANASIRNKIDSVCRSKGFEPTTICTPEELLEV